MGCTDGAKTVSDSWRGAVDKTFGSRKLFILACLSHCRKRMALRERLQLRVEYRAKETEEKQY